MHILAHVDHSISVITNELCHGSTHADIDTAQTNENGCVPVNLYLQKQMVVWNCPAGHNLPTYRKVPEKTKWHLTNVSPYPDMFNLAQSVFWSRKTLKSSRILLKIQIQSFSWESGRLITQGPHSYVSTSVSNCLELSGGCRHCEGSLSFPGPHCPHHRPITFLALRFNISCHIASCSPTFSLILRNYFSEPASIPNVGK